MLYKASCSSSSIIFHNVSLTSFYFFIIIVLNSLRCLKREVQETRLPSSNDQVTEEDIKTFKHTQELTTKVNGVFV